MDKPEVTAAVGYPSAWEGDALLTDGTGIRIRPIRPEDADALRRFHLRLSPETIHRRYFGAHPELSEEEVGRLAGVDYSSRMAFVAVRRDELVAVAQYEAVPGGAEAELALVVSDDFQGRGVGTILIEQLASYGRTRGIEHFIADTLPDNRAMLVVFKDLGLPTTSEHLGDAVRVRIDLAPTPSYLLAREARERRAIARSLRPLLAPTSVAVIGASRRKGAAGHEIVRSLLGSDFTGRIYPVNPKARSVCGVPTYGSVGEVPEHVDLAVIAVPAVAVPGVVEECAEAGVGSLAVISSGFAETGPEGRELETAALATARRSGIRMLGPNCLGLLVTDPEIQMNATFSPVAPDRGGVALASQSGALGVVLLERARQAGIGLSAFVSTGNKADVSSNDLLCAWEDDPSTRVIALYLESFGNPRKFARIARRVARKKPIVALKSGTSVAGARGARSHSAAAATPEVAVESLLRSSGVMQARGLDELLDIVTISASSPLPAGRRVALVGNSGGPLVLTADACEDAGLEVPELSGETAADLLALMPPQSAATNPVDMTSGGDAACLTAVLDRTLADPGIDAVIAVVTSLNALSGEDAVTAIAAVASRSTKPIVTCLAGGGAESCTPAGANDEPGRTTAVVTSPERAARALGQLATYAEWLKRPEPEPELLDAFDAQAARGVVTRRLGTPDGAGWLGAAEAWELVRAAGLPAPAVEVARGVDEVLAAGLRVGYPLALKAAAGTLVHKSDVGGVVLGVGGPEELAEAYSSMRASLGEQGEEVLLQAMAPHGVETIVGMSADPLFGPLVVVGLGGVATDLLADHAFGVPPLTRAEAREMLLRLRGAPLLTGYRGSVPVDLDALADVVCRVAALSEACPEIVELDCNPVLASPEGALVVDVKVRLERPLDAPDPLTRMLRRVPPSATTAATWLEQRAERA